MTRPTEPRAPEKARRPISISAGSIEVVFTWRGDRWGHRILVDGSAAWESVEGPWPATADPRWPASPVLVELDRLGRGPDGALVAVGQAGRSHFAASVSCVAAAAGTGELLFELACRAVERPGWLGSSYRRAAGRGVGPAATIRPIAGCSPAGGDECDSVRETAAGPTDRQPIHRLLAVTRPEAGRTGPTTVAWSYRIGLERPHRPG